MAIHVEKLKKKLCFPLFFIRPTFFNISNKKKKLMLRSLSVTSICAISPLDLHLCFGGCHWSLLKKIFYDDDFAPKAKRFLHYNSERFYDGFPLLRLRLGICSNPWLEHRRESSRFYQFLNGNPAKQWVQSSQKGGDCNDGAHGEERRPKSFNSSKIFFATFQKWQPLPSNREMKNEER